jgi:hypothetical protein
MSDINPANLPAGHPTPVSPTLPSAGEGSAAAEAITAASTDAEATAAAEAAKDELARIHIRKIYLQRRPYVRAEWLLRHAHAAALTDLEKRGLSASIDEENVFAHYIWTVAEMLRKPGARRDELLRCLEADPDALVKDLGLASRINQHFANLEFRAKNPEVGPERLR